MVPLVADAGADDLHRPRQARAAAARAGDAVRLAIAPDRLHFFDLETGEAIANRAQPAATG